MLALLSCALNVTFIWIELSDVTMEVLLPLSCVYLRLGDLQVTNNNFKDAFDDYKHALEIRQQLCNDYDRYRMIAIEHMTIVIF